MTIALTVRVNDGIILAADSAGSLPANGGGIANVYNSMNKIINLYKTLPIGYMTWGEAGIGSQSVATLMKDFRIKLGEKDESGAPKEYGIDENNYTIKEVVDKACQFFSTFISAGCQPSLGFSISGYSSNSMLAEEWIVEIEQGNIPIPSQMIFPWGIKWNGQPKPLQRLVLGYDPDISGVFTKIGFAQVQIDFIMNEIHTNFDAALVHPAMPIQDAIDLAEFLVYTASMYYRFIPGAPTVGGPIEVAAITKHEGFKWVKRKMYYNDTYNPEV